MPTPCPVGIVRRGPTPAQQQSPGIRGVAGALLLATCLVACPHARAESPLAPSGSPTARELDGPLLRLAAGDTVEIVARRYARLSPDWSLPLPSYLTDPTPQAPTPRSRRSLVFTALTRARTYQRPRYVRAIYGADRFAGTAAAVGGLGLLGGVWGGKTAGYFMGAGAVLGALWGGTLGADTPGIRIGVEPVPPGRRDADPRPPDSRGRQR
jgi:hypothetical protein